MSNLFSVKPEFLQTLANAQDNTTTEIKSAIQTVSGISEEVCTTHGSACSSFNTTLAKYVSLRSAAGAGLEKLATQVGRSLRTAAKVYTEADDGLAGILDKFKFSG
ncbi:ESX-1 secretion-associated protein [Mycobacterium decipiens]|uniref:ESX-1 secretion-associated protein n=1 Tax=Mycobacterium decipiens TaxID=1430326 RepID=A0A1X2LZT3_9MYCO|nr:ESX-1 secretion-associated protein [Mycobacterium decipiens]OSC42884.1 hypothetical protein B8W66_00200 [Mycobacterium decipiens]